MVDQPKETCRICNRPFSSLYMPTHLRRQHNVYGGRTGRVRLHGKSQRIQAALNRASTTTLAPVPAPAPKPTEPQLRILKDMRVAIDQDGGMWVCEQIR